MNVLHGASGLAKVETERIQLAVANGGDGRPRSTLWTYLRLQPGRWWEWLFIWVLQNGRYCPVYVLPLLTARLVDLAVNGTTAALLAQIPWITLASLGLCVLTVVCNTWSRILLSRINRTMTANLRASLLRRINRLALTFHDRRQIGELQNKFTLDMTRLEGCENFVAEALLMFGTTVVVMLAIVAWTNPLLFVVLALIVPLNVMIIRLFFGRIGSLNEDFRKAENDFLSRLMEALTGLRVTRAHATEGFVEDRVERAAGQVAQKAIRLDLMNNLFGSMSWSVSALLNMGVVILGLWLVTLHGRQVTLAGHAIAVPALTIGGFTILLSYYGTISGSIGAILGNIPALAAAKDAIHSLAMLYHDAEEERSGGGLHVAGLRGDVAFERVSFAYPGADRLCLEDLDLSIPAGSSLALVGPSGGGKSTIASLMLGFYRPTAGRVLLDGRDLAQLDCRSLRQHVGVVSQDIILFQDTVLANVAWGDRRPDRRKALAALELANAREFIDQLPGGLDHLLGDRGTGLSGGQRQRLAIARALYRDPRLLILDEATSALDLDSEKKVQQALDGLKRDRTTLIIAHRLSTVQRADRIVVVGHGRVVESGTFAELMSASGLFRQLAEQQLT
jgi:ATP-binding cassette subfamily B protein